MKDQRTVGLGFAWYRPEQWSLLRAVAADSEVLEQTHSEWLNGATKAFVELQKAGVLVSKVDVDINELAQWCRENDRALDSAARSLFAAQKLKKSYDAP